MDRKFGEKAKKSISKVVGYAIWVLIVLLALSLIKNVGRRARIEAEIDDERAKIAKIQEDNRRLEEEILQAESGDFIESQIRNKLGLVKEGETIVVLPDEEILKSLAPQSMFEENALPDPNWRKWLKLFSVI
ncbi:MAG TPA: septum formation initiator family protein [Patescibacteria group bacterium]|nr:septum formation initiator family protein [Patescibacteria group bacterium]